MDEIYIEYFVAYRALYEDSRDIRNKALQKVNDFFSIKTGYKPINIIEEWSEGKTQLCLIVYYY